MEAVLVSNSSPVLTVKLEKNQRIIAEKCYVAESFFDRLRGLIGKRGLEPGFGMLFPRCNDIHMWFMRIPIDVIFASRKSEAGPEGSRILQVTRAVESVRPWRFLPLRDYRASDTLELPVGTIRNCDIRPGDELSLRKNPMNTMG